MMKIKDLDTILNDTSTRVYIRNSSLRNQLMVVLEMKDKNGRGRALKIPPTNVPICLTDMFSREVLRESNDLRQCLSRGNIVLVDPKEAEEYLKQPSAKEEMKIFAMSAYADSAPTNPVSDSMAKLGKKSKKVLDKTDILAKKEDKDDVNVRIKTAIGSFKSGEKNSKDTLAQILRLKTVLTRSDLTYIMQECAEDQQIKKFAESALAELEASPESPF